MRRYIPLLLLLVIFSACLTEKRKSLRIPKGVSLSHTNIINPYNLPYLFNANNSFVFTFSDSALHEIRARKCTMISYGGENPDEIREKLCFTFMKNGLVDEFAYYRTPKINDYFTKVKYEYEGDRVVNLNYDYYMGTRQDVNTRILYEQNRIVMKVNRQASTNQLEIYGEINKPRILVDRVRDKIFSINYFLPYGESLSKIREYDSLFQSEPGEISRALRTVTYTENGKPMVAYLLGMNNVQERRVQLYEYDRQGKISSYKQWLADDLVTEIRFGYTNENLPETIAYNNQEYHIEFD